MRSRRPVLSAAALVTTLLVSGTALAVTTAEPATRATGPGVVGIDVSRYQHPRGARIDWADVRRSGQEFVFVKATEGTTVRNAHFEADRRDARAAGLYVGAYHYARPHRTPGSALAQAQAFVGVIGDQQRVGTLPPVLDLEANDSRMRPAELLAWARAFLSAVEQRTGRRPIVYSYPAFWSASMGGTRELAGYPLWIAHYTSRDAPRTPGWSAWTFWQHTSSGSVPGVRGKVDRNRFRGTSQQLAALALDPVAAGAPEGIDVLQFLEDALASLGLAP